MKIQEELLAHQDTKDSEKRQKTVSKCKDTTTKTNKKYELQMDFERSLTIANLFFGNLPAPENKNVITSTQTIHSIINLFKLLSFHD